MPDAFPADLVPTLTPQTFLGQYLPEPAALARLLTAAAEQFFIVPVEQMYPLFGRAIPPVRATAHSLLLITSGTARMRIGTGSYAAAAGEVLVVRAGQLYSFEPGDENTGLLCHVHDDFLLGPGGAPDSLGGFAFLQFWGQPLIRLGAAAPFAADVLRRLLAEYQAHGLRYPELLRAYLHALLHELARAYAADTPAPPGAALQLTRRFQHLLRSGPPAALRVRDVAARLCVTPGHLSRCVRQVTGRSAAQWIEESQVLAAKALLYQTHLPVADVAQAVGVADASYFSRLFRKHTGLTPLAFRQGRIPS